MLEISQNDAIWTSFSRKCVSQKRTLFRPYFIEVLIRKIPPRKKTNFHPKNRPLRSHKKIVFHNIPRKRTSFDQHISHIFTKKRELECYFWQIENLNVILRTSPPWISIFKFYDNIIQKKTENLNVIIQNTKIWMSKFYYISKVFSHRSLSPPDPPN